MTSLDESNSICALSEWYMYYLHSIFVQVVWCIMYTLIQCYVHFVGDGDMHSHAMTGAGVSQLCNTLIS